MPGEVNRGQRRRALVHQKERRAAQGQQRKDVEGDEQELPPRPELEPSEIDEGQDNDRQRRNAGLAELGQRRDLRQIVRGDEGQ